MAKVSLALPKGPNKEGDEAHVTLHRKLPHKAAIGDCVGSELMEPGDKLTVDSGDAAYVVIKLSD